MSILDFFITKEEKGRRIGRLHDRFCIVVSGYLSDEDSFCDFINGQRCSIYYSSSQNSVAMGGDNLKSRYDKVIDLSKLNEFSRIKNKYQELMEKNVSWQEIFENLDYSIIDLSLEAVMEFAKKYSLPKVGTPLG